MRGGLEGGLFRMGENGLYSRVGKGIDFFGRGEFLEGGGVGRGVDFSTGRGGLFPRPPLVKVLSAFILFCFNLRS